MDKGSHIKGSFLDALEHSVVVFGRSFEPIFLNSSAAQALRIVNRTKPEESISLLEPFISLLRNHGTLAASRQLSSQFQAVEELLLVDSRGVKFSVIAKSVFDRFTLSVVEGDFEAQYLLSFYDLRFAERISRLFTNWQKERFSLIRSKSIFLGKLALDSTDLKEVEILYETAKKRADLISDFSSAVEIIDHLVPRDIKFSFHFHSSVLLDLSKQKFREIIALILVESADFLLIDGTVTISSNLVQGKIINEEKAKEQSDYCEIQVVAQSSPDSISQLTSFERYLFSEFFPRPRVVNVTENPDCVAETSSQEFGIKARGQMGDAYIRAEKLARECQVGISCNRYSQNHLSISLRLPLILNKQSNNSRMLG